MENGRGLQSSAGAGLAIYTATYDAVGYRLTSKELDSALVTYGYDNSYQLVRDQRSGADPYDVSYTYDGLGNRLTMVDTGAVTTFTYNPANELTLMQPPTGQPTTSSYDANGNLTLERTGNARTTYTWDGEDRLLKVEVSSGVETYAYSADGLRQWRHTGANPLYFVWDDGNYLMEVQ